MGLFSKLFGEQTEKAAQDFFKDLAKAAQSVAENKPVQSNETQQQDAAPAPSAAPERRGAGPSGFSWGEDMPAEENQFNYNGPYTEYFEKIFNSEFPQYRVVREPQNSSKRVIYGFYLGDRKALVVELMSQSCEAKKLRADCAAQGIPYLRYYYDHDGWWNTRSYVVTRTRAALGL